MRPPDNSNQFAFCKVIRKIGILLYFVCPKTESRVNSWVQERTLKTSYLSPSRACMSSLKITLLWKCRERWNLREHEVLKSKMVYFSFNRTWVPRKSGKYFPVKEFLSNGQSINRMYTCVTTFSFVSFFSYLPRKNPTEHLIADREQLYLFFYPATILILKGFLERISSDLKSVITKLWGQGIYKTNNTTAHKCWRIIVEKNCHCVSSAFSGSNQDFIYPETLTRPLVHWCT